MATDATAIIAIPEALLETAATRHFEGTLDLAELAAGPDTYTFAAPVTWSVEATNTGDAILIQGTAAGDATTQCARCLEDVTYGLEGDIEGYFLIGGEEEPGIAETFALYTALNTSIETQILPKTKHMPQMEAPQALLEQIQIFFAPVQ